MGPRYRSLSGALIDPEKRRDSYDNDLDSPHSLDSSSRDTSASYQPMLGGNNGPRPPKFAYHLPRRRFSRYFTLILFSTIVLFIFYLVHASRASNARLLQAVLNPGAGRPPDPRPWEGFPFLTRYHGGIRTLVPRDERHVPEYPADEDVEIQRLQDAAMKIKEQVDVVVGKEKGFGKRKTRRVRRKDEIDDMETVTEKKISGTGSEFPKGLRFDPYSKDSDATDFEPPVKCYLNRTTKMAVPKLWVYPGVTKGFPDPVMGSYEIFGMRNDVCFERYGRLGPYGYGYSKKFGGSGAGMDGEKEGSEKVWDGELEIDYREVQWGLAQEQCFETNAHRFRPSTDDEASHAFTSMGNAKPKRDSSAQNDSDKKSLTANGKKYLKRSAVIIRTWSEYEYDDEDLFYLRSIVNELSIQSGGEYTVHFLVHVKDDNLQIWADEDTYQRALNDALPAEFRGMGTLWSERQMSLIYGGVSESNYRNLPVHGAYRSTYMPMQYFAHKHPEYDFFWHWEMDIRYTGHFYHLFDKVSRWAKKQPRKGLWERNSRFYVPSEHGDWEDFRQMVRVQTEHGTANRQNFYNKVSGDAGSADPLNSDARKPETPVWGPLPPTGENDQTSRPELDPQPLTTYDKDNYEWGVGEDADFITFNPLFDPHHTNWILSEDVTGYNTSRGFPPRRTAIITASRLSRRLLETMHLETALQRHTMFSEMWPGSCALHHGLKAVYAPHPVYVDRAWPTSYLAAVFNNGRNGAAGGARTSVFSDERQHNFMGMTWYYVTGFSPNLWRRWMGFRVDNDGGEQWEIANEGRMCVPGMLLHPVKQVDLVYEHYEDEKHEEG